MALTDPTDPRDRRDEMIRLRHEATSWECLLAVVEETGEDVPVTHPQDEDNLTLGQTVEWKPSRQDAVALNLAGLLAAVLGVAGYGALAITRHQPAESFVIAGTDLLLGLLGMATTLVGLVVVHEGIHGLAMWPFGARPSFGVGMGGGGFLPYVYTTAPGHLFTRTGYVVVALAPSVILIALTAALVGWTPSGGWMVVPAAFHLAGCVGDWWLVGLAGRQPAGSRYEDLHEGLRIHLP